MGPVKGDQRPPDVGAIAFQAALAQQALDWGAGHVLDIAAGAAEPQPARKAADGIVAGGSRAAEGGLELLPEEVAIGLLDATARS